MDKLRAMGIFAQVADKGGFAAAARHLNMSPPSVTRAVAQLEDSVGAALLVRSTRRVSLTDAGRRYLALCRQVLAQVREADAVATGLQAAPSGVLAVTAPVMFGEKCVMPVLQTLLARHPGLSARSFFIDRMVNLLDEGMDVAVRIGPVADPTLDARMVGHVRHMIVAAPAYLEEAGTPDSPQALEGHHLIAPTGAWSGHQWDFGGAGPRRVPVSPRLTTNTNESALNAATAGLGITRLLSYQAAPAIADGRLIPILEAFEPDPAPVALVTPKGRQRPAKTAAFMEQAQTEIPKVAGVLGE
ncbi:LysR family transcriptional regulator [Yunchengibacter salinarum]|uniref:LysR family transcriptional regulator n=1 Tax=Yunchengibacter salinarum TaxID=3133399 RepID=UPI0035B6987F